MMVKICLLGSFVLISRFNKKKNNVLSLLLTLECIVLLLFISLCFISELYFAVIFLRVGACEAAIGLGCLVGLIRFVGQRHIDFLEYDHNCIFLVNWSSHGRLVSIQLSSC